MRNTRKSLKDVASAARVSVATASRVARGNSSVDPELRKRVIEAAAELGFALERNRGGNALAFVLSNRAVLHPFHSHILVGADAQRSARGRDMIFLAFRYALNAP